jgi:superfamily II DNA or RNA helicase
MELREHQIKAIEMIRDSFRRGNRRVMLAACCSFGKTITSAAIIKACIDKNPNARIIFMADRVKLVNQTMDAFEAAGLDFGVIQADHWMTNSSKQVQIASIQTIARRRRPPEYDFAIVDEAHTPWKAVIEQMERYSAIKFLGLSATPYSKGLGKYWDDLVIPCTAAELLEKGYLAPIHYYGGSHVDTKGIKARALATGGSDFDPAALEAATEAQAEGLTGDIIRNWLEHGENSQTIAFSPSIKHSKYLVEMFRAAGISAEHIDGYTEESERQRLYTGHDAGDFKILSCSKLLGVGYDSPKTRCLISCQPTRSAIAYQQQAGRIQRLHESKPYAIYLDHASNVSRFGYAEHMNATELDDGERKFAEINQLEKKEKAEATTRNCPQCSQIMAGLRCSCGYELTITERLESDTTMLVRLDDKPKAPTKDEKSLWYSNLLKYSRGKGWQDGWAAHSYRKRFGKWPKGLNVDLRTEIAPEVANWIKSRQIAAAKSRKYNKF